MKLYATPLPWNRRRSRASPKQLSKPGNSAASVAESVTNPC